MAERAGQRRSLRQARAQLPLHLRQTWQQACNQHLMDWLRQLRPQRIAAYLACGSELDLHIALRAALDQSIDLYLPAIIGPHLMEFRRWRGAAAELQLGPHGFLAPFDGPVCAPQQLEVVVAPGVGFAPDGARLGSGAGYYDRCFAFRRTSAPPPLLIGAGFSMQRVPVLETAEWDVRMDVLLDEDGITAVAPVAEPGQGRAG